ncbi:LysM peptidoglycan-binding domain-containing protein [Hymenobacter latericus]|uniref:LysM peptidoglycan-binding domain-containing protein n=1 Tax=Hymenobacter sp. YIM 151858-1 TaxID=2987688 RepID=UPI002227FC0D|nr:DUF1571 domain-containing protein [Hymenobacter sp. YIM 151858-1]UYZ59918.1 DUF1571 domain-containing protein [Hymenobacter sp. YIM 151858-1]
MLFSLNWLPVVVSLLAPAAPAAADARAPGNTAAEAPSVDNLLSRLSAAISRLQTLRCTVKASERHDGAYQQALTQMKVSSSPLRVYLRTNKGIEVLWVQGQNDGDAWVYPNKFPYVTLSLDPNGSLMRRTQHHSVTDAGYGTIADLIRMAPQRSEAYRRSFRYAGDTTVQGRLCYLLRSDFPQFRYISHKTTAGETVGKIAERYGCGEYRIAERNNVDYTSPLPAGRVLQVPNAYGRRTILCVEQKSMLPLAVAVWDDKGLFESFEFSQVVANQPIAAAEFTKDYKGYKF